MKGALSDTAALRGELVHHDPIDNGHNLMHDTLAFPFPAENTVLHGVGKSHLSLPVIPR